MSNPDGALLSLDGLSVGDAFGERFFAVSSQLIGERQLPPGAPWPWTDDTHMAISVVEILLRHGRIDQEALAAAFAKRHADEPWRGYGGGAKRLLQQVHEGADWRDVAPRLFDGGSYGNGGAMRAAPIGGYFAGDPAAAATAGCQSAMISHAHPEGQAGAMAVAVAAAIAAGGRPPQGRSFLEIVLQHVPEGDTRRGVERARAIPAGEHTRAVRELGTGSHISAQDTVPFCLWVAAHHLDNYEEALWQTVAGGGDRDTTCAIVGGIVALAVGRVPGEWRRRREPLPALPLV